MNFEKIFRESSNPLFQKITPKYIKNIFRKQYGPNGPEECDQNRFEELYSDEVMDKFIQDFDEKFLDRIEVDGNSLILYRGLYLKSPENLIRQDKKGNPYFGICWTINEELFNREHTYCCNSKPINTILKAKVPIEGVDWKNTILFFYFYSFKRFYNLGASYGQAPELEIRIKKNAPVELLEVKEK